MTQIPSIFVVGEQNFLFLILLSKVSSLTLSDKNPFLAKERKTQQSEKEIKRPQILDACHLKKELKNGQRFTVCIVLSFFKALVSLFVHII